MTPEKKRLVIACLAVGVIGLISAPAEFASPEPSIERVVTYAIVGIASVVFAVWCWKST